MEKCENPNASNILFKAWTSGDFIALRTYDRRHGARGRFLVSTDALREWLDGSRSRPFYDSDCGNFLRILQTGDIFTLDLHWLSAYGECDLHGFRQVLDVSEFSFLQLVNDSRPIRQVCRYGSKNAVVDSSHAGVVLRHIQQQKRVRRAFSKAMRDCFHWKDEVVSLYADGEDSFYFTTRSGFPACGGLILHEGTISTPCGKYPRLLYSIHT